MYTVQQLPPIAFVDSPVDLNIHFYPENRGFACDLSALGQREYIQIGLSIHDIEAINQELQAELESLVLSITADPCSDQGELSTRIHRLAESGYLAYRRVFGEKHQLVSRLLTTLTEEVTHRPPVIEIPADAFYLPWELFYPANPISDQFELERFWGFQFVLSRILTSPSNRQSFVSPRIKCDRPIVSLLADETLQSVRSSEVPFFRSLHDSGKIQLNELSPLNPQNRREGLSQLASFLEQRCTVTHFACHASFTTPTDQSRFLLPSDFDLYVRDFELYEIRNVDRPLVILNACESGERNPFYTASFASCLFDFGARAVIATECAVPDTLAARVGQELHSSLLGGTPVGDSLLHVRRMLLQRDNDPSGLLYSLYGPAQTRILIGEENA